MTASRLLTVCLPLAMALSAAPVAAQRLAELPRAAHPVHALTVGDLSSLDVTPVRVSRRGSATDRIDNVRRGALWGLGIYTVLAASYVAHEAATCHGPECFGEGFAWIGLAAGFPLAAAVGAGIGAVWPTGS